MNRAHVEVEKNINTVASKKNSKRPSHLESFLICTASFKTVQETLFGSVIRIEHKEVRGLCSWAGGPTRSLPAF